MSRNKKLLAVAVLLAVALSLNNKNQPRVEGETISIWNKIKKEDRIRLIQGHLVTKKELILYNKLHALKDPEYQSIEAQNLLKKIGNLRMQEREIYATIFSNPQEARNYLESINKYHKINIEVN